MLDRTLVFTKIEGVLSPNDKHTLQICMKSLIKICQDLKAEVVLIDVPDYHQDRSRCTPGTRALLEEFDNLDLSIAGEVNSETIEKWLEYNQHGGIILLINEEDTEAFEKYNYHVVDKSILLSYRDEEPVLSQMRRNVYRK